MQQDFEEYFLCINKQCPVQDKLNKGFQNVLLHMQNDCKPYSLIQIRNDITNEKSEISQAIKQYSTDALIQRVEDWKTAMTVEFNKCLLQEAENLTRQVQSFTNFLQEIQVTYKAIQEYDLNYLRQNVEEILRLMNQTKEVNEVKNKVEAAFQNAENFKQQLRKNIKWSQLITIKNYDDLMKISSSDKCSVDKVDIRLEKNNWIQGLQTIKNLTQLNNLVIDLHGNQIQNIQPIAELKNLTQLTSLHIRLNQNQIQNIQPIAEFKNLTKLTSLNIHLQSNQIQNIHPIVELKNLNQLTKLEIYFSDNPIQTNCFKSTIIKLNDIKQASSK